MQAVNPLTALPWRALVAAVAALSLCSAAHAAKEDRDKPLIFEALKQGRYEGARQAMELSGNVVLTKGSMLLRAERLTLQADAQGYQRAQAHGAVGQQVTFQQDRDQPGEVIHGRADRIEYDERSDMVRLIGNAEIQTRRGSVITSAFSGAQISFNARTEVLDVNPGASAPNPGGRIRGMVMPRGASAPDAAASEALQLQPARQINPGRTP
ncbi:lipopolysaccharide transport periplasmic protein LptA [Roseateles sp. BYS180W]|uniref:Lipopolysaccharide export system protein LptA n=1 Tax=Roseateles rivi TaxID=3299028 RepID=A0ABW7FTS7_9BURK